MELAIYSASLIIWSCNLFLIINLKNTSALPRPYQTSAIPVLILLYKKAKMTAQVKLKQIYLYKFLNSTLIAVTLCLDTNYVCRTTKNPEKGWSVHTVDWYWEILYKPLKVDRDTAENASKKLSSLLHYSLFVLSAVRMARKRCMEHALFACRLVVHSMYASIKH